MRSYEPSFYTRSKRGSGWSRQLLYKPTLMSTHVLCKITWNLIILKFQVDLIGRSKDNQVLVENSIFIKFYIATVTGVIHMKCTVYIYVPFGKILDLSDWLFKSYSKIEIFVHMTYVLRKSESFNNSWRINQITAKFYHKVHFWYM